MIPLHMGPTVLIKGLKGKAHVTRGRRWKLTREKEKSDANFARPTHGTPFEMRKPPIVRKMSL